MAAALRAADVAEPQAPVLRSQSGAWSNPRSPHRLQGVRPASRPGSAVRRGDDVRVLRIRVPVERADLARFLSRRRMVTQRLHALCADLGGLLEGRWEEHTSELQSLAYLVC